MIGHMQWRNQMHHPERRMAQINAVRLRNVLKLPKAHKWVFYEWFYSNLDRYTYYLYFLDHYCWVKMIFAYVCERTFLMLKQEDFLEHIGHYFVV